MIKWLNFNDFWNLGAINFTMILANKNVVFFLVVLVLLVHIIFFSLIFMKKQFFGFMAISVLKKILLIFFFNNVLTCLPNMLTFALKKIPHTGDKESRDQCGSQDRYNFGEVARFIFKKKILDFFLGGGLQGMEVCMMHVLLHFQLFLQLCRKVL